jgi:hypothetical protein
MTNTTLADFSPSERRELNKAYSLAYRQLLLRYSGRHADEQELVKTQVSGVRLDFYVCALTECLDHVIAYASADMTFNPVSYFETLVAQLESLPESDRNNPLDGNAVIVSTD